MGLPSDLTDEQWERLEPLIPAAKSGGRLRRTDMRAEMNAILYLHSTGCPWPRGICPWSVSTAVDGLQHLPPDPARRRERRLLSQALNLFGCSKIFKYVSGCLTELF